VTGIISLEAVHSLEPLTETALGVIAYLIGASLHLGTLRSLGKSISWITLLQCLGGFAAVALGLLVVGGWVMPGYTMRETYLPFGLMMGAIASATAPPAILAIVRELRAKGPMTTTLLAAVALDDGIAVILFALAAAYSGVLIGTSTAGSLLEVIGVPVLHLGGAVVCGTVASAITIFMSRFVRTNETALVLVLGVVLLNYSVAELGGMSGIIACMTLGLIVANHPGSHDLVVAGDEVQGVLFTMFFVISGLHFDVSSFAVAGPLAVIIVITRCVGKYTGARVGGIVGQAPPKVGENIGLALMPQAGVSLGLVLIAATNFPQLGNAMVSATLASVIINELITPPMAKAALVRSGEVRADGRDELRRGVAAKPVAAEDGRSGPPGSVEQ